LDALQISDKIALPRRIRVAQPTNPLSSDALILLAHLIGDGCILPKQPYHSTSADDANIEAVAQAAKKLFQIEARIVPQKNWKHAYLPAPYHLTQGVKHPITTWYAAMGISRVRAHEKRLPALIFECDNANICLFLRHLWATDGNISWKNLSERKPSAAIYYATTSIELAEQVQHLLLRLGILSTMRTSPKKGYRPTYQVHISGQAHQNEFLKSVGCHGERGKIIPALLMALSEIKSNPNTDIIPLEAWQLAVEPCKNAAGLNWRALQSGLSMQYCGSTIFKSGISRDRMLRLSTLLPFEPIRRLAESDIFWDEIISIEPAGMEDVYDATIPTTSNFVANDIIVHNSIEQDADMVAFIYRPEYYQILEDESGNSLKGVAEFIIAKHRHGALETVKLKFTDTFAKFSNLDDPTFGGIDNPLTGPFQPSVVTRSSRMNDEDIPF
jgi:replicative DNA helicase